MPAPFDRPAAVDLFSGAGVMNELDRARLVANARASAGNHYLRSAVVQICPEALGRVHLDVGEKRGKSAPQIAGLIDENRIIGIDAWLASLLT